VSTVIVSGMWVCQDCGESGAVEPVEAGESVYVEHSCHGDDYPEDERW